MLRGAPRLLLALAKGCYENRKECAFCVGAARTDGGRARFFLPVTLSYGTRRSRKSWRGAGEKGERKAGRHGFLGWFFRWLRRRVFAHVTHTGLFFSLPCIGGKGLPVAGWAGVPAGCPGGGGESFLKCPVRAGGQQWGRARIERAWSFSWQKFCSSVDMIQEDRWYLRSLLTLRLWKRKEKSGYVYLVSCFLHCATEKVFVTKFINEEEKVQLFVTDSNLFFSSSSSQTTADTGWCVPNVD